MLGQRDGHAEHRPAGLIEDATFRFVDLATPTGAPAISEIKHFNLRVADAALEKPIRIDVDAALFSEATNFRFSTTVGPIPADLKLPELPPVQAITLRADAVDLSRLSPYLPDSELARIDSALFSADWKIGAVSEKRGVPWSVFRAISDWAGDPDVDADLVGLSNPDGSPRPGAALRYVLRRPWRIPKLARLGKGMQLAVRASTAPLLALL